MKKLFLVLISILSYGFVNAQTIHLTTSKFFCQSPPTKGDQKMEFTLSKDSVIVNDQKQITKYVVTDTYVNEWSSTVYKTKDKFGNTIKWSHGKSSMGDEFLKYESTVTTIIYSNNEL